MYGHHKDVTPPAVNRKIDRHNWQYDIHPSVAGGNETTDIWQEVGWINRCPKLITIFTKMTTYCLDFLIQEIIIKNIYQ